MRQSLRQLAVTTVETRSHCALRTTHHARNLFVRQTLDVLQQDRQTKLRLELADGSLHGFSNFEPSVLLLLRSLFAGLSQGHSLSPRQQSPAAAPFVETGIDDQPVKPGGKLRVTSKLSNSGEQLQKYLLRDVIRQRSVAARVNSDGEHLVFVRLEEKLEGSAVTLLAGFNDPSVDKLFSHHHR